MSTEAITALPGASENQPAGHELSGRLLQAQEQERARLARELHDDITQRLARLAIDVGRIERTMPGTAATPMLHDVQQELSRLSEDVHALAYRLHPSVLEDLGLADAIRTECEHHARLQTVRMKIEIGPLPAKLPMDLSLCLFRIAQEALRNIARHAHANAVHVSLGVVDGWLQLTVRDDGIGFDTAADRGHPSLGLASMRERVRLLDGEVRIDSARPGGTTVNARVTFRGLSQ